MKLSRISYVLVLITLLFIGVQAQSENIIITVDASQDMGDINPFIFGFNTTPSGISLDAQNYMPEIDTNFLRWPGGNWGDLNNVTHRDIDWYMHNSEMWNAVPSIHVRLGGGTPEQAADLVRYANVESGYGIRYWYIGNEPNLYDDYTAEQFIADWREFALAMLAVDPDIILIGPEISQFPDQEVGDYHANLRDEWLRDFLLANGDLVDIVSIHRYPFPLNRTEATTIAEARENVPRWEKLVELLRSTIQETLGEDRPIAITEVNSHWSNSGGGEASPDSYYNAIWWSGVLTTLIHEKVDMVAFWNLFSVGSNGQFGILDRYNPRPTYYTYRMFNDFGLGQIFTSSSDEYVTAVAGKREDGSTTLIITNLYEEPIDVELDLHDLDIENVSEARLLAPDILAEIIDVGSYLDGTTLSLPGQSVILLIVDGQ